jgi:hypothetical protein
MVTLAGEATSHLSPTLTRLGHDLQLQQRERELDVIAGALDDMAAGRGLMVVPEGREDQPPGVQLRGAQARAFSVASARGSDPETSYQDPEQTRPGVNAA